MWSRWREHDGTRVVTVAWSPIYHVTEAYDKLKPDIPWPIAGDRPKKNQTGNITADWESRREEKVLYGNSMFLNVLRIWWNFGLKSSHWLLWYAISLQKTRNWNIIIHVCKKKTKTKKLFKLLTRFTGVQMIYILILFFFWSVDFFSIAISRYFTCASGDNATHRLVAKFVIKLQNM